MSCNLFEPNFDPNSLAEKLPTPHVLFVHNASEMAHLCHLAHVLSKV